MIRRNLHFFYDIYSAIDQYYQKQIRCCLFLLLNFFDIFIKENQKDLP